MRGRDSPGDAGSRDGATVTKTAPGPARGWALGHGKPPGGERDEPGLVPTPLVTWPLWSPEGTSVRHGGLPDGRPRRCNARDHTVLTSKWAQGSPNPWLRERGTRPDLWPAGPGWHFSRTVGGPHCPWLSWPVSLSPTCVGACGGVGACSLLVTTLSWAPEAEALASGRTAYFSQVAHLKNTSSRRCQAPSSALTHQG